MTPITQARPGPGRRARRRRAQPGRPLLDRGDVALVAHGHLLRVLTARWLGLEPRAGRFFRLDTGTLSVLGFEHEEPVISMWNMPPDGLA